MGTRSNLSKKHKDIQCNIDGTSAAFILEDFEFRAKNNMRINNDSGKDIIKACITNIKWRYQKNNDNGQVISYIEDYKNKKHCFVRASKRIRKRAKKLKIPNDKPIAVYTDTNRNKKKACNIDDVHISSILQEAALKCMISQNKKN